MTANTYFCNALNCPRMVEYSQSISHGKSIFGEKIRYVTGLDLIKCLKQIK